MALLNSPLSSSCGRWFDAFAAVLDLCPERVSYEGQAAMQLESLAASEISQQGNNSYPYKIEQQLLSLCFLFYGCASQVAPELIDKTPQKDVSPTKLIDKILQHNVFPSEPQLRLNLAMHTAMINEVDTDRQQRYAVTASNDKSILVWNLITGEMLKRLRLPSAEIDISKAYTVAISPDGEQVAVGGLTGKGSGKEIIYIFQRSTGVISHKILRLENVIYHLAYSADGRYLAASLGGSNGVRIYDSSDYREIYADKDYQDSSLWVSWRDNIDLLTSSYDGKIRLYQKGTKNWVLVNNFDTGQKPFGLAVHPAGTKLAVGFKDSTDLLLLTLPAFKTVTAPSTEMVTNGNLGRVTWSYKGERLWAGGKYDEKGYNPILGWQDAKGKQFSVLITTSTVMNIHPLSNGDLLVASANGLTRVSSQGELRWQKLQPLADFRGQTGDNSIRLAHDGSRASFGFSPLGKDPTVWDLALNRAWVGGQQPSKDNKPMQAVITQSDTIKVSNWRNNVHPTVNGVRLKLEEGERSRSLAIAPDQQSFVLGTEWYLRRFNPQGKQIWQQVLPGVAWTVAISGDGRWLVAGLADGTLRWYDFQTGEEQLAFFAHNNRKDWVSWTPEGFFSSSSPEANHLFGYQINNGSDAPDFIGAEQLYKYFYRPDLVLAKFEGRQQPIQQALAEMGDIRQVLASRPPHIKLSKAIAQQINSTELTLPITLTDQGGGIGQLTVRVNGAVINARAGSRSRRSGIKQESELKLSIPAGQISTIEITGSNLKGSAESETLSLQVASTAQGNSQPPILRGLAIGIENYQEGSFKLKYAIDDIKAFKKPLEAKGKLLYKDVDIDILPDATYAEIIAAFDDAQNQVGEDDIFVLYLSGHGVTDNGNYHFLAQDFIWNSPHALQEKTIDTAKLNTFLVNIKARKVVVFMDTCYAGSYQPKVEPLLALNMIKSGAQDKQAVARIMLEQKTAVERLNQQSGRAFFYASSNQEIALEGYKNHGLYTALLLQGLSDAPSGDQHISLSELRAYLEETMPKVSHTQFKVRLYPMAHVPTSFNFVSK